MMTMTPLSKNIVIICLCLFIALLFIDNFLIRSKLKAIQFAIDNGESFIEKILPFDDRLKNVETNLAENESRDQKFQENQTEFDRKVITVFKEKGLIQ